MAKARRPKVTVDVKGSATAIAKATFQRKKLITEVIPPDVIRAKAGRWLDLISPITEWAGLRGDALRHKRNILRIQQETVLDSLATRIRQKVNPEDVVQPLPPKFLVPALEAASLEDPHSPIIEWWADLLAAGAKGGSTRPYLIELMRQIGSEEAVVLEELWTATFNGAYRELSSARFHLGDVVPLLVWTSFEAHMTGHDRSESLRSATVQDRNGHVSELVAEFVKWAEQQGTPARVTISNPNGSIVWPSSEIMIKAAPSLDVLCALNVIAYHSTGRQLRNAIGETRHYEIRFLHFTKLGVEFMAACRPLAGVTDAQTSL